MGPVPFDRTPSRAAPFGDGAHRHPAARRAGGMLAAVLVVLAVPLVAGCDGGPAHQPLVEAQGEMEDVPRPPRGTAWVIFGADTVRAEVAATPQERERGLQFREDLPQGSGMLFVFEEAEPRAFWMEDTFIPLDIAYMDQRMRIVDIQQMEPETDRLYESAAPAMFALEVPQGWFEAQGVGVGDEAEIVFGPI